MIIEPIFFLKTSQAATSCFSEEETDRGPIFSFIIDSIDEPFSHIFYNNSFFGAASRFCLAVDFQLLNDLQEDKTNDLVEYLGPLFFNRNYFTVNGFPLINILSDEERIVNDERGKESLDRLNRMLTILGYERFYYSFIDEGQGKIVDTNVPAGLYLYNGSSPDDNNDLNNWYLHLLENHVSHRKFGYFFASLEGHMAKIYAVLRHAESELKNRDPLSFALMEEQAHLVRQMEQHEIQVHGLKKEIESREAHIASLQNIPQTSFKKLNDFYHYEYEILPAWYKRFGHIIKVIMGKRTFRSLFSHNVKKYKD